MIEANSVLSTPRTNSPIGMPADSTRAILRGLAIQQRARETALRRLRRLRKKAKAEIARLIDFLDRSDEYVMTELEDDDDREEVGDAEPSLGSFDRIGNQEHAWRSSGDLDAEQDDCDRENNDPNEEKQQPPEMRPCA